MCVCAREYNKASVNRFAVCYCAIQLLDFLLAMCAAVAAATAVATTLFSCLSTIYIQRVACYMLLKIFWVVQR